MWLQAARLAPLRSLFASWLLPRGAAKSRVVRAVHRGCFAAPSGATQVGVHPRNFEVTPTTPLRTLWSLLASALPPMARMKQALRKKFAAGREAPRKQRAPKAARKSGAPSHRTQPDPVPCSLCAEPGVSLRAGTWVCAKHSREAETAEWQRREAKRKRAADAAAAAAAEDAAHDARIDAAEAESSESEGGAILPADGVVHSAARKALRLQHALSHAKPEAVVAHLLAVAEGWDAAAQHALAKMLPKAAFPTVRLSAVVAPRSAGAYALTRAVCGHRRRRHTSARAAAKNSTRTTHTGVRQSTTSMTAAPSCARIVGTTRTTGAARGAASASTAARKARTTWACALTATTRRRSKGAS